MEDKYVVIKESDLLNFLTDQPETREEAKRIVENHTIPAQQLWDAAQLCSFEPHHEPEFFNDYNTFLTEKFDK
jgi:hypothetical protein